VIPQEFQVYNQPGFCNVCLGKIEQPQDLLTCSSCGFFCHIECYGFVNDELKAQGQQPNWVCIKCHQQSQYMSCVFCPMFGGSFKMTETLQWGHISCAMWIPEVEFADDMLNEYIIGIDKIHKSRWSLKCMLCKIQHGTPIQCSKNKCTNSYHVTCAQKHGLFMELTDPVTGQSSFKTYCTAHDPRKKPAQKPDFQEFLQQIEIGKTVWGKWLDGYYYSGKVVALPPVPEGKEPCVKVDFDDGTSRKLKSREISFTKPVEKAVEPDEFELPEPAPRVGNGFEVEARSQTTDEGGKNNGESSEGSSSQRRRNRAVHNYKVLNG